jgi:hypothetical protein
MLTGRGRDEDQSGSLFRFYAEIRQTLRQMHHALPRVNPAHPLLALPAMSVDCSGTEARLRTTARWTKEKAAEIAADSMTTFYHVQVGALETQGFLTTLVPFLLVT